MLLTNALRLLRRILNYRRYCRYYYGDDSFGYTRDGDDYDYGDGYDDYGCECCSYDAQGGEYDCRYGYG